jgi:hypothetical protein
MELDIQYLNDKNGDLKAVQIPINDWKWLQSKFKLFSQELTVKKDLIQALFEVEQMRNGKIKKQSLDEFLKEL